MLERQQRTEQQAECFALSRLLAEHAERLLRMSGLIPRPSVQKQEERGPRRERCIPIPVTAESPSSEGESEQTCDESDSTESCD
jgi:hypothetical protein